MSERRAKPERNLEEELDTLLAEIEQKVPDLTASGGSGLKPQPSVASSASLATAIEPKTAPPKAVEPMPPQPAAVADNVRATEEEIAALMAAATGAPEPDAAPRATSPSPPTPSFPSAPSAPPAQPPGPTTALPNEATLAAQIQSLLDQALMPTTSAPSPNTSTPPGIACQSDNTAPAANPAPPIPPPMTSPPPPSPAADSPSAAIQAHASAPLPDDTTAERILEQIDEDLAKQAEAALVADLDTLQPGRPTSGSGATDDPALGLGTVAAQVAAELDSQSPTSATQESQTTPIPAIPPQTPTTTTPGSPPTPVLPAPPAPDTTTHGQIPDADTISTKRRSWLNLASPFAGLRALLTLLNAPLIHANPSIRQAVGFLGLGNLLIGSLWIAWLLLVRH